MLKIGVIGAGHLGKIHIKLIKELTDHFELIGFCDADGENAKEVERELNIPAYNSPQQLIDKVDVVDIVTPTVSHFELAQLAIKNCKHVFIEKPVTQTFDQAKKLAHLAEEADVKVQVGHVERFNPAFIASKDSIVNPMFIEAHRLAEFNPRGTDVSVVLDLMIHDLDIILSVVKSNIKRISASGVAVVSDTPDITNARIEFDNGCVANLTASRISMKNMRKSRFFQKDAYVSVDFLEKKSEIISLEEAKEDISDFDVVLDLGEGKGKKKISFDRPNVEPNNAIKDELRTFAEAISTNTDPIVTLSDGSKALDVALQIMSKVTVTNDLYI